MSAYKLGEVDQSDWRHLEHAMVLEEYVPRTVYYKDNAFTSMQLDSM